MPPGFPGGTFPTLALSYPGGWGGGKKAGRFQEKLGLLGQEAGEVGSGLNRRKALGRAEVGHAEAVGHPVQGAAGHSRAAGDFLIKWPHESNVEPGPGGSASGRERAGEVRKDRRPNR
ncbi:hypothetical protein Thermus72351_21170 [Thermus brockianus]